MRILKALPLLFLLACQTTTPPSRLETMRRHDEWIDVSREGRNVKTYVVYPERSDKAPVVVVIHENRGLTDWVRTVADQLAERGYIAVAPDLLSGAAPGGGNTRDFPSEDAAREAIGRLPRAQYIDDIKSVVAWSRAIPAGTGKVSVAGFCWGGSRTWDAANEAGPLSAAYVFYGTGPQEAAGVEKISAPVYGFYGGNDARVNATIAGSEAVMRAAGKTFEPVIYEGAGHAFMRLGELPDSTPENKKARDEAWSRWLSLLQKHN